LVHRFAGPNRSADDEEDFDFVTQSCDSHWKPAVIKSRIPGRESGTSATSGVFVDKTKGEAAGDFLLLRYTTVPLSVAREVRDASGLPELEDGSLVVVFNEIDKSEVPLNNNKIDGVEKVAAVAMKIDAEKHAGRMSEGPTSSRRGGSTPAVDVKVRGGIRATTAMVIPKNLMNKKFRMSNKVVPQNMKEEIFPNPMILEKQGGYFVFTPLKYEQTRLTLTLKLCNLDEVRRRDKRRGCEGGEC